MQYEMCQDTINTIGDNASVLYDLIDYMWKSDWICNTREGMLFTEILLDSIDNILCSIMPHYFVDNERTKALLWQSLIERLTY